MRTTIDIDERLLVEVAALTHEKSKSRAVALALMEYVRRRRTDELIDMAGHIDLVDNLKELEELELKELGKASW